MLKQFLECELGLEKIVCDCIGYFSVKISIRLEFNCFHYLKICVKWPLSNTASNHCLLLQKEQNVKGGEGPSGKQAVGINNGTQ